MNPRIRTITRRFWKAWMLTCLCVIFLFSTVTRARDPDPPIQDGLELRLDAREVNAIRRAQGLAPLPDGTPVGFWPDAGPRLAHLTQRVDAAMPIYHEPPGGNAAAFIRFDGKDDFLQWSGAAESLRGATIILVASPRANNGIFSAILAGTGRERNDYTSGFNVDLGPAGTPQFSTLNIEGAGFGGAVNLVRQAFPFGTFHIITILIPDKPGAVELYLDGQPQGTRPRDARPLGIEELTLGARLYSNTGAPPHVQGFWNGDVASAYLYSRVLLPEERRQMESYLRERHAPLMRLNGLDDSPQLHVGVEGSVIPLEYEPPGARGGPPIQFFAPGFEARELPLELKNINNLAYRADGTLVALGYDGAIYLLRDSDGDGLEDDARIFWEKGKLRGPIGMAPTPKDYTGGNGVFVASKGKISLILDTDGDDRADVEKIVATGWEEIPQAVDALGVALDKEGNIFFGLGTADYTNPYLLDPTTGKARYSASGERGTIQRVSPDFSRRETICSGVRFTVAVKFNAAGDLFCTDQEGQTWLPGGNPFDELLNIQPGRHYGFPPRHPTHLPDVFDEPSVCLYGPQHQSTCGLCFNEAPEGSPIFGPEQWRGNAFVAGYSRGRIFRTELVKTEEGYVARNHAFACLGMLPVEVALTPAGELLVSCHSGEPDWGSGPEGMGKLFKISYSNKSAPQPVAAWATGPLEASVAFDRPIPPEALEKIRAEVSITYGRYVRAGDGFEAFRPGYQLVQEQMATPRYRLGIGAVTLADDNRTLVVGTQPHAIEAWHNIRIPNPFDGEAQQTRTIEMDYTLNGWQTEWEGNQGKEHWTGWIPHADLDAASGFLRKSSEIEGFTRALGKKGTLTLRTHFIPPQDAEALIIRGRGIVQIFTGDQQAAFDQSTENTYSEIKPPVGDAASETPLKIVMGTGGQSWLRLAWKAFGNPHERPLAPEAFVLPWAPEREKGDASSVPPPVPKLEGGNWLRGESLFFGEARCHQCHQLRGRGRAIGPDLSNLIYRDAGSVTRDILQPSAAINPDYVTYHVRLKSGAEFDSLLKTGAEGVIHAFDSNGEEKTFPPDEVAEYRSSGISTMPEGLADALDESKFRDLLTFLLEAPPHMPRSLGGGPAPRKIREVEAALGHSLMDAGASQSVNSGDPNPGPFRVVLVASAQDHGPGEHDYPAWQTAWKRLLEMSPGVEVATSWEWPSDEDFARANVIVFYCWSHPWSAAKLPAFQDYLARGGGLVFLHAAVIVDRDFEEFERVIGLVARMDKTGYRHGPLSLNFSPGVDHPVSVGLGESVHFEDESYWPLQGDESHVRVLATGVEEGKPRPLVWTFQPGAGRVFCSVPGHYSWTFDDPLYRVIVLRAIAWTGRQQMSRFENLALAGVELLSE